MDIEQVMRAISDYKACISNAEDKNRSALVDEFNTASENFINILKARMKWFQEGSLLLRRGE